MENSRRVDEHSGAMVYPPDSPEVFAKRRQNNQMKELLEGMRDLKIQVTSLEADVRDIKQLMLAKKLN